MRRSEPPDYLWFAILSLTFFVPLAFVDLVGGGMSLAASIRELARGSPAWPVMLGRSVALAPILAVPAAGLGWWLQGVAVRRGLRISGRPDGPQQADYDGPPPAGPPPEPPVDMNRPTTVFVPLLMEGTDVWRPVLAQPVGPMLFRLTGPMPDGESWAFEPDTVVRCWERTFGDGTRGLVAVERADL